jgi:MSHA biogenesis protein MshL
MPHHQPPRYPLLLALLLFLLAGCGANLPERPLDGRHLVPDDTIPVGTIPDIVQAPPLLAPPAEQVPLEVYSVVVHDVPAQELLFALARDAELNLDVHPGISGNVTLNAIDQTLPQILSRIARQVDIRWDLSPPSLIVEPDSPVFRNYRIDYVNISRQSTGEVNVATSISTTGSSGGDSGGSSSGDNNSTTQLRQESNNTFWATLVANLQGILGESGGEAATDGQSSSNNLIVNAESGIISVRGTTRQHEDIQIFLDLLHRRALQQVLIEATVVEVRLKNQYQFGVDWATIGRDSGAYSFVQSLTGLNLSYPPVSTLTIDRSDGPDAMTATVKMLEQFGDLKVLSSPKLMVLNNQTALLKVVDNKVYFTVEVTPGELDSDGNLTTRPLYTTTVQTVPIGFVMAVTPQISESDQVTLNVRPTISRIIGYVFDPNPTLAENNVINRVPEVQVREVESILKVTSGQIGVLGGLMQDTLDKSTAGIPGLSRLPFIGNLFSYRDDTADKTELVIFIRPAIIRQASLNGDLAHLRDLLPTAPPVLTTGQQIRQIATPRIR